MDELNTVIQRDLDLTALETLKSSQTYPVAFKKSCFGVKIYLRGALFK